MARFLQWLRHAEPFSKSTQKLSKKAAECHKIVFIRHGQSTWNQKNQYCGWYDSHLSEQGREEATKAGKCLKEMGIKFHHGFTSKLCRSIQTLQIVLKEIDQKDIQVDQDWRLNERHYGNLTGMNKAESMELFGKEKVHMWRRSFDTRPPKMLEVNPYYAKVMDHKKYDLEEGQVPLCESLRDTIERTLPYWDDHITPEIKRGKTVIVAAHGNSLRGIVKHIEGITEEGIQYLNLPTGVPFMYTVDSCMMAVEEDPVEFLGDEDKAAKAMKDLKKAKCPPDEKKDSEKC